ncbi:DEAD/SNF2 helicase [uncultured virus]|nr:DEAD/SNF2 helicase [uncultured virus]
MADNIQVNDPTTSEQETDSSQSSTEKDRDNLKKIMNIDYTYPEPSDPEFQRKIYDKREFYYHRKPGRGELVDYKDIKEYRDNICSRKFELQEHQALLSNFVNPDTPYRGLLIFHGTGTGKCATKDTLVYVNGELKTLENIWNENNSGVKFIDIDGGELSDPKNKLTVNSINCKGKKIIKRDVVHLYREKINFKIREIILENGQNIKITLPHKLLKQDGWTFNLKPGDYIATPKIVYNSPELQTANITKELISLLAWQMSEGNERTDKFGLIIFNPKVNFLRKNIDKIYLKYNLKMTNQTNNNLGYLRLYSKKYAQFLLDNGYKWGVQSDQKQFPNFIMNLPKTKLALFLKNYLDSCTNISLSKKKIQYYCPSKMLIDQLYYLLKIFEINSVVTNTFNYLPDTKKKYYELTIFGLSLNKYRENIGFYSQNKQKILNEICLEEFNMHNKLPINDILLELWKETKLPYDKFANQKFIHTNKAPTVNQVCKIIQNLNNIINNLNLQKEYKINSKKFKNIFITKLKLEDELTNDINYVRIKKINEMDYCGYVYDLEIQDHHNYVANGINISNTCVGIAIAERFKAMVQKYNTKIYVLVSGPLIKENWKNELLTCTGETYLKQQDKTIYMSEPERLKARKNAINVALQYYRFMSYRSFYKKVLGEKIVEKIKTKDEKIKVTYRKTKEGEFERDVAIDRIYNLNNSLIIIDEAHNLTGNAYGEALMQIIKNSHNLRVILLTATPMKNLADDIVELINFIRPNNDLMGRDKVFTSEKNHQMDFKSGGIEYLKKMTRGYISYLRGADPLTFAKRLEKGTIPKSLLFTKIVQCRMRPFQRKIYDEVARIADDTLDRRSEAVANFAFPGLSHDRKELTGYFGREGLNSVKNQLKTHYELINKKIANDILNIESLDEGDLIYLTEDGKTITGKILRFDNLKNFSVKFYKALKKINRLVWGKKGSRTSFVYSNLVKVGIEIFQEILMQNGFLEYNDNPTNYKIKADTICYFCGKTYKEHQQMTLKLNAEQRRIKGQEENISESSTEYKLKTDNPPTHQYYPATYFSVIGKSTEEAAEIVPEDKQRVIKYVFNNIENKEGKYIKLILGSKVMQEGISLSNIAEVHILDVYFNLGKVDQVIGRAIRHCSHYNIISDENRFPVVNVYKYAVTLEKGGELSSEEDLYRKAELKYILIKKVERALKEIAIDCPLNRNGNIFPEELTKYKDCIEPSRDMKDTDLMCPALCDYTKCNFFCDDKNLNKNYFDYTINSYKRIPKNKLDYSTFTNNLARNEIDIIKNKIKELYKIRYVFTLSEIINYVKNSYEGEKKDLFDEFFVFKALDEMIPITENDFNNFRDTIFDKFNRSGYLIYINKYYIFQPFDQNEDVPMFYRSSFDRPMQHQLTLYNYIKNTAQYEDTTEEDNLTEKEKGLQQVLYQPYDFESAMEYYDNREESKWVGIIDKESSRRKTKSVEELQDVFKLRPKRSKIQAKKRGTGITSVRGASCTTAFSRNKLLSIAKTIDVDIGQNDSREDICGKLRNRLFHLEKYSLDKDKITYMMIPSNHPTIPFPLNIFDRKNSVLNQIKDRIKFKIDIKTKDIKKKVEGKNVVTYRIEIKNTNELKEFDEFFEKLGGFKENNNIIILIE